MVNLKWCFRIKNGFGIKGKIKLVPLWKWCLDKK